jgi:hypothetical protein
MMPTAIPSAQITPTMASARCFAFSVTAAIKPAERTEKPIVPTA